MNIKSQKDFLSGLVFMGAGVAFAWGAGSHRIGSAAHMGEGYFPLLLGIVLAILGGIVTFKALVVETVDGDKMGAFAWRPLVCIILANALFGAMVGGLPSIHLPPMGLMAGVYVLTCVAYFAGSTCSVKEMVLLATVVALVSYWVFIVWFKLPIPAWPVLAGA